VGKVKIKKGAQQLPVPVPVTAAVYKLVDSGSHHHRRRPPNQQVPPSGQRFANLRPATGSSSGLQTLRSTRDVIDDSGLQTRVPRTRTSWTTEVLELCERGKNHHQQQCSSNSGVTDVHCHFLGDLPADFCQFSTFFNYCY
jgi:hypothetical protein